VRGMNTDMVEENVSPIFFAEQRFLTILYLREFSFFLVRPSAPFPNVKRPSLGGCGAV